MVKIFVWQSLPCRTTIRIVFFVVLVVRWLKTSFIGVNRLTRNICLNSAFKHIGVNLRTIVPLVGADRFCFKAIFVDLCFDPFGMNGTVIDVSGRDKNVCDQAMLTITGLVAQIMKSVWFPGTMHITAFGIGLAFFDLLGFRLYMICVIRLKKAVRDCLLVQSFDIGARLVGNSNGFVEIVSCIGTDVS